MRRNPRELQHLKSSRTTTGKGIPRNDEGADGDLALRLTNSGLKLFAKYQNKWYIVGEYMKEAVVDEKKHGKKGPQPLVHATFTRNGDMELQRGGRISFDGSVPKVYITENFDPGLPTNNRNLRAVVNGRDMMYMFEMGSGSWVSFGTAGSKNPIAAKAIMFDFLEIGSSQDKIDNISTGEIATFVGGTNTFTVSATGLSTGANLRMSISDDTIASTTSGIILDSGRELVLDAANGAFIAKNNGAEFSARNSAYAGMILAYTQIGENEIHYSYTLTTAYVTIDSNAKVTFVAPPSGNVEIMIQVQRDSVSSNRTLFLALSDNATFNSIGTTYEQLNSMADETDDTVIQHYWTVTGLLPGTSYTYWLGAKTTASSMTLRWGGTGTDRYCDFIMKATALPGILGPM